MGCDIHAYIDYDEFKDRDGNPVAWGFAERIHFGRNYTLFTLMAGVRHDPRVSNYEPMFEPRGLPGNVSWSTRGAYVLRVNDELKSDGYCSQADAERWTARGVSDWMDDEHKIISHPDWHTPSWLTVAELEQVKSAYEAIPFPEQSWFQFNPPEQQPVPEGARVQKLEQRHFGKEWYVEVGEVKTYQVPNTFNAIIAAMKALDDDTPGRSRFVFWFDN